MSKLYRVGVTFESSVLCMYEPTARAERAKTQGANAWKYKPASRHWELCKVDCKTGELFTVSELEKEPRK